MARVFISHSWEDNTASKAIAEYLKKNGAEIWIDYSRIKGGQSLPQKISDALTWCDTLALVWSRAAATSYYVKLEWQSALSLRKTIVPCRLDDAELPPILSSLLYIDFRSFESGCEKLGQALDLIHTSRQILKSSQIDEKKEIMKRELRDLARKIVELWGQICEIDWSPDDDPDWDERDEHERLELEYESMVRDYRQKFGETYDPLEMLRG